PKRFAHRAADAIRDDHLDRPAQVLAFEGGETTLEILPAVDRRHDDRQRRHVAELCRTQDSAGSGPAPAGRSASHSSVSGASSSMSVTMSPSAADTPATRSWRVVARSGAGMNSTVGHVFSRSRYSSAAQLRATTTSMSRAAHGGRSDV